MNKILIIVLLVWNLAVFALYGIDKSKAKHGAWRISEKALFLCAFLFGAIGAFIGMKTFRHKTQHKKFTILVPIFVLLNIAAIVYLFFFR